MKMNNLGLILWCGSITYLLLASYSLKAVLASIIMYHILMVVQYKYRFMDINQQVYKAWIALVTLWVVYIMDIMYKNPIENFDSLEEISDQLGIIRQQMYEMQMNREKTDKEIVNNQLKIAKLLT
jgi:hypothetical protein